MSKNFASINFNIDNILLDGKKIPIPKYIKAIIRITNRSIFLRKNILIIYPNYICTYLPVLLLGSYFYFKAHRQSRIGIKILVATRSETTIQNYQNLVNQFGTPFINSIYSGFISKNQNKRLKSQGSSIGSHYGKVDSKYFNIIFIKPGYIEELLSQNIIFDSCIIEDCQIFYKKRYNNAFIKISESKIPTIAIITEPDFRKLEYFESYGFNIFGWDENLLISEARRYKDFDAFGTEETYFPLVQVIDLPLDEYHKILNFVWLAYFRSKNAVRGMNNEILFKIFHLISGIIRDLMNLAFPLELLYQVQESCQKFSLTKKLSYINGYINQIPNNLNQILEIETIVNLIERVLCLKPTKQNYYENNFRNDSVNFVTAYDPIILKGIKTYFGNKHGLNIFEPTSKDQIKKSRVLLNGFYGRIYDDYKMIKNIKTEKLEVLSYKFEREIVDRIQNNRILIRNRLSDRAKILHDFGI